MGGGLYFSWCTLKNDRFSKTICDRFLYDCFLKTIAFEKTIVFEKKDVIENYVNDR